MADADKNIFRPNILLLTVGTALSVFFLTLLTIVVINKGSAIKLTEAIVLTAIICIFIWCLSICLDAWDVKIDKRKIFIKRLWTRRWTEINVDDFNRIKFSAGLDDNLLLYKKLTIYTNDKRRFNFYSHTENINDNLYLALLSQTPQLLADYKNEKHKLENRIKAIQKTFKWTILILLILLAILYFRFGV